MTTGAPMEKTMDYLKLLEHSYEVVRTGGECPPENRLEYLGDHIFDFTTYDGEMSALFARKAVEVCSAINDGTTFDYIRGDAENYLWYLLMCNMPFFEERLEWGTSIRGAWWGAMPGGQIEFQSCGLWVGDDQCADPMKFSAEEWGKFIAAVVEFACDEMKPNAIVRGGSDEK